MIKYVSKKIKYLILNQIFIQKRKIKPEFSVIFLLYLFYDYFYKIPIFIKNDFSEGTHCLIYNK
jgi:hypothetical protein